MLPALESVTIGKRCEAGASDDVLLVRVEPQRLFVAIVDGATHGHPGLTGRALAAVTADALLRILGSVQHMDPTELATRVDELLVDFVAAKLRHAGPLPSAEPMALRTCTAVAAVVDPEQLLFVVVGDCFAAGSGVTDDYDYTFLVTGERDGQGRFGLSATANGGTIDVAMSPALCKLYSGVGTAYLGSDGAAYHFAGDDGGEELRSPYVVSPERLDRASWTDLVTGLGAAQTPGTVRNDDITLARFRFGGPP